MCSRHPRVLKISVGEVAVAAAFCVNRERSTDYRASARRTKQRALALVVAVSSQ